MTCDYPDRTGGAGRPRISHVDTLFYTQETSYQDFAIYRGELPNGAAVRLFEVAGLREFLPGDKQILISSNGTSFDDPPGGLMISPANGKGPTLGLSGDNLRGYHVLRTAQRAYWITVGRGFQYQFADLAGDTVNNPVELPLSFGFELIHDDKFVYFTDSETKAERVYRMPIEGGDLLPIATFKEREVRGFALHGKTLLVGVGYAATTGLVAIALP